jgi:hypothetical protein
MTNLLSKTVWVCQSAGAEMLLAKMWMAPDSSPTASRRLKEAVSRGLRGASAV